MLLNSQTLGQQNNPGGSFGNLCVTTRIGRYVVQGAGASGTISLRLNLDQTPTPAGPVAIAPGETWNFQLWHRDTVAGQVGSNFTHGYSIRFR